MEEQKTRLVQGRKQESETRKLGKSEFEKQAG